MVKALFSVLVFLAVCSANAAETLRLWPPAAFGETAAAAGLETTSLSSRLVGGKPVVRLGNVRVPTITLYQPPSGMDTGLAVVVCPGGGYGILAVDLEGTEICQWLNSIGVSGVLLKYRVPPSNGVAPYIAPLQDAQRALGLVRFHAVVAIQRWFEKGVKWAKEAKYPRISTTYADDGRFQKNLSKRGRIEMVYTPLTAVFEPALTSR